MSSACHLQDEGGRNGGVRSNQTRYIRVYERSMRQKQASVTFSILQLDNVLRKPLVRGYFINSGIRNFKVISVSHCGGRIQ